MVIIDPMTLLAKVRGPTEPCRIFMRELMTGRVATYPGFPSIIPFFEVAALGNQ